MSTIVIFGAGTGLGLALARRFGKEGYQVALVGRTQATLDTLTATLSDEGVEAAAFVADLSDLAQIDAALAGIRDRFGTIDVVEYAPISPDPFTPAAELDTTRLQVDVDLFLRAPVHIVQRVLPDMVAAGDGAILVTHGGSAVYPVAGMSGVGPIMAATRNYLYSLHEEVAGRGVYVGTLVVSALIAGSASHAAASAAAQPIEDSGFPIVSSDDLADIYWHMVRDRDRTEAFYPASPPS